MYLTHLFLLSHSKHYNSSALFETHITLDKSLKVLLLPIHLSNLTVNGQ